MTPAKRSKSITLALALLALGGSARAADFGRGFPGAVGPLYATSERPRSSGLARVRPGADAVRHWNEVALAATGLDHTQVAPGEHRVFGEQLGPTRSSRAMAIVHIAMFDAMNAIEGRYQSYTGLRHVGGDASVEAAMSQAAHDTLAALYPSQADSFDADLASELARIRDGRAESDGIELGARAAAAILALRAHDGSERPDPRVGVDFITSDEVGRWRQDPVSLGPLALGAFWGEVTPFVMQSGDQFRVPPPPPLDSAEYTAAFDEVKAIGGDGIHTATTRTQEETDIGLFWAYDGTPSLCAPPRLYNQITMHIADELGTSGDVVELSRLLALVNVAMADAGIAVWDSKFFYQFWRPVTGIRESDPGTGPTGLGDGNPDTTGDPGFFPLGAPASNLTGPNFTPPFPAYPSGHAGFGGALFEILRAFYGTDDIGFTFTSDELDGITVDDQGHVRPLLPRSFASLSDAEQENGQSRIYLGIHWAFDKTEGIAQGERVADYVFTHAFLPAHPAHSLQPGTEPR